MRFERGLWFAQVRDPIVASIVQFGGPTVLACRV